MLLVRKYFLKGNKLRTGNKTNCKFNFESNEKLNFSMMSKQS